MKKTLFKNTEEVLAKLKPAYNHQFKEFDINHRLDNPNNKGALGQIVEEGILGYPINSDPEADIKELGLEVKTTGVIQTRNDKIRAKERLTIDAINYNDIIADDFESSPVWQKADDMLLVFYNYIKNIPYGDFRIIKGVINKFSPEDVEIMENDYNTILSKIKNGKAEEISEGDTMYLGACTAGTGALQNQPFSKIKAKQRKFCIKESYFTQLVRKYLTNEEFEHALSISDLKHNSFEMAMTSTLSKYYGFTEFQIRNQFNVKCLQNAKNRFERYIAAILGIKGDVNRTEEFIKGGITMKTIRQNKKGRIKESMSFPSFSFIDVSSQEWETSDLRNMFASRKFMFVVFQERDGEMVFKKVKFWNMPETLLDTEVRKVFDKLKKTLLDGNIVREIKHTPDGKEVRFNNFPGMASNDVVHVRPHGRNADDTDDLPIPDKKTGTVVYTKQAFWLNNKFIRKIIND